MFWAVFGSLVLISISLHYFYVTLVAFTYWKRRGVDHETPTYPLGNLSLSEIISTPTKDLMKGLYGSIKGPFLGYMVYTRPVLILKDPELINRILVKDFHYFNSRIEVDFTNDPLFGSLFIMNDERWKIFRQKLSPIFAPNRLRDIFESIEMKYRGLEDFIAANKTDGITLDFYSLIKRYLVDVMAAVLLGINVDYVNNPKDDVRFMSEEAIPPTGRTAFTLFFSYLAPGIKRKLHYNFFRKEVQDFVVGLVESVMKFRDDNPTERFDFLHKLMEMRENGKTPKGFSIEVLSAQLLFIILAGYEATGTAISFCLWELARNPMVQARAQEEVDRIIAQHDGKFTLEALKEMTYIDNCLSETLRLHSPLTFLIRICNEDYHCEKHNLVIEKNTTIIVPLPSPKGR